MVVCRSDFDWESGYRWLSVESLVVEAQEVTGHVGSQSVLSERSSVDIERRDRGEESRAWEERREHRTGLNKKQVDGFPSGLELVRVESSVLILLKLQHTFSYFFLSSCRSV